MPPLVGVKMELRSFINLKTGEHHDHQTQSSTRKLSLLELASELNNVSKAKRFGGVRADAFCKYQSSSCQQ